MIEAFVSFCGTRRFISRQQRSIFIGHQQRVNHLILCIARVHITSLYPNLCSCSIEILKFQFADFSSVHGISPFRTKFLHIKLVSSQTDFLIRIKTDTNITMLDFRMCNQISHRTYNFCNSGLIVRSQQGMPVGHNQILTYMIQQFREISRRQNNILFRTQRNILSIVFLNDTRFHILSAHIRTGIHVSNKADHRNLMVHIRRKCGKQIPVFIQGNIFQSQFLQLRFQVLRKYHLLRRTRSDTGRFVRLRIKSHIL